MLVLFQVMIVSALLFQMGAHMDIRSNCMAFNSSPVYRP